MPGHGPPLGNPQSLSCLPRVGAEAGQKSMARGKDLAWTRDLASPALPQPGDEI